MDLICTWLCLALLADHGARRSSIMRERSSCVEDALKQLQHPALKENFRSIEEVLKIFSKIHS